METETSRLDWQTPFKAMLERRAHADYMASGRTLKERARWIPPEWLRDAIDALNRNDENAAKRIMLDAYIPSER